MGNDISDKIFVSAHLIAKDPNADICTTLKKELIEKELKINKELKTYNDEAKSGPLIHRTTKAKTTIRTEAVALNQSLGNMFQSDGIDINIRLELHETLCNFLARYALMSDISRRI